MHATCVEGLQVFQRARRLAVAVFAQTQAFRGDYWLRDQLAESAESVISNIAEGFGQATDRAFARSVGIAAGSAEEVRTHLLAADMKCLVGHARAVELMDEARQIVRMLNALAGYLRRSDRKRRGGLD